MFVLYTRYKLVEGNMAYDAEVLADSVTEDGERITTIMVTMPRMILAEFNTHRALSRNSASSRAIPVETQLQAVLSDPFTPLVWGTNQRGMQAGGRLTELEAEIADRAWLYVRDAAVLGAVALNAGIDNLKDADLRTRINEIEARWNIHLEPSPRPVHKQLASRLLEPFMWQTVITTATDWDNFFALRDHQEAQPEMQAVAHEMRLALDQSTPRTLHRGEWHLPFILDEERWRPAEELARIAVARCARVSYRTHGTDHVDVHRDLALYDRLASGGHLSPLEHVARPMTKSERQRFRGRLGNVRGWVQFRKTIPGEDDFSQILAARGKDADG